MKKLVLAAVSIIAVSSSANATQLVSNGNFSQTSTVTLPRSPALDVQVATGWTSYATAGGTISPDLPISGGSNSVFYPAQVRSFDTTGSGASNALWLNAGDGVPPFGDSDLQGGGVSQTISSLGGVASFSANIASQSNFSNPGGIFSVLIDDVVVATYDFGTIAAGTSRSTLSFSQWLDAGDHVLKLQVVRPFAPGVGLRGQYFDNVSLDQVASVPEPATWAMMIGGFGLVGGAMRRRRSVSVSFA